MSEAANARDSPAIRGLQLFALALLAAFILRAVTGLGGDAIQRVFATWVSDAIGVIAVAVCLWRAVVDPRGRALWGFAGIGMASWVLGNAYFEHMLAGGESLPNPSPADIGYLAFYPLVYLALVWGHHRRPEVAPAAAVWLDGAIGAAACVTVATAVLLPQVLDATAGESFAGALTNIAYPIGDATLFAMLVVTFATVGWRVSRGSLALAVGMALFALSDALYIVENAAGSYSPGGILDAGWLVALVVMAAGAGALTHGPVHRAHKALRWRIVIPAAAGAAALVVLALQPIAEFDVATLVLATVTLALVIIRLTVSLRETAAVLTRRAREAERDSLTGLKNRRKLLADLGAAAAAASEERPLLLVLLDLDGFKTYNDTFGHPAGDELLAQVARGLRRAVGERGDAYRMGGDEFCALLSVDSRHPESTAEKLAAAMGRRGAGFAVTATYGYSICPADGRAATSLIRRADDEMYANKAQRRPGPDTQVQDALTAALGARDPAMETHASMVSQRAAALGGRLGFRGSELQALEHAAALHDIGKIAIPETMLEKDREMEPEERRFLHTHPLIAQRIVSAAPALEYVGHIVRSVQERWDGNGFPDGLEAEAIPLEARIIAVCNAYETMTADRPGHTAMSQEEAVEALWRGAGGQFDPKLIQPLLETLPTLNTVTQARAPSSPDLRLSSRRRLEEKVTYQADHDLLTGLLNRRRFSEELERMLRYSSRYRRPGALLILDVDNLKLVNDLHGHAAGDAALMFLAERIRARVRGSDAIGRLGGDEFAIALNEARESEAVRVAGDIIELLAESGEQARVQVSAGIALFDGAHELMPDDLLTAADVALYEAKTAGREQVRVYRGDVAAASGWVQRIRDALDDEAFVLYAQPIVDLAGGWIERRELLLRMLSPDGDVIPPGTFIPTAERFGLIQEIDRRVVAAGLRLAADGRPVSVNLSAHSIGDAAILREVESAAQGGLRPGAVLFEITETAAMSNMQTARDFSERLASLGCDVALDDFGTGFGSFSYLKHLPSRYLKIDIDFVRGLPSSRTDQEVVRAITDVGHSLGKRIIAEGAEDEASVELLRQYRVDLGQGLYFGAPERLPVRLAALPAAAGAGADAKPTSR